MLGTAGVQGQEVDPAQRVQELRRMILRDFAGAGHVPHLGITAEATPEALAAQIGLPQGAGLVVQTVAEGSVAAEAGIKQHDVLHKLGEEVIVDTEQLRTLLDAHEAGDKVTFTVVRAAKPIEVEATLREKPVVEAAPFPNVHAMQLRMIKAPFLGVATEPLNAQHAANLGLEENSKGLLVHAVIDGSPAAAAGLRQNDVIQKINDKPVHHPDELREMIRAAKAGDEVTLEVVRDLEVIEVKAKLVEREVAEHGGRFLPADRLFLVRPGEMNEAFPHTEFELRMNEMLEQMGPEMQQMREQMQRMMREMQERGPGARLDGPHFRLEIPEGMAAGGVSVTTVADGEHVITLTRNADGATLQAKDAAGNVIFEGPYNTDEDKAKVPEEIRAKVDRIKVNPFPGKPTEPKPNLMV